MLKPLLFYEGDTSQIHQIAQGTVEVRYCPTEAMAADYMIKTLQGELFRAHKKNIMGTPPN